jgi:intracellular sulfur oxidation DsrE/DsrF family protein
MTDFLPTPRRGFLSRAATALFGVVAAPSLASADVLASEVPADEAWLQGLNGKHKQFFDAASGRDGRALGRVANFLNAYAEAYGMKDVDLSVVFGAHGAALPLVMNDALWAKYEFGRRYAENDPVTRAPATRNPFASGGDMSVARLQERGVRFIVCLRSIRRLSGELAPNAATAEQVRQEIIAHLLPGVTPVPAMIVATNRAQEAGLTYVYAG